MVKEQRNDRFVTVGVPVKISDSADSPFLGDAKNPLSVQSEDMYALILSSKGQQVHSWTV